MQGETIADLVVVAIVVLSGLFALARGLVKELLSIASWAGAVLVTLFGFFPLRPFAREFIQWELAADIATGAVLFLGSLFILSYLAHFVSRAVQGSAMGALDRTLGFVFGLARGVLIAILLFLGLSWTFGPAEQPGWFRNARTAPLLAAGGRTLVALLPQDMRGMFPHVVTPTRTPQSAPPPAPAREGYRPAERREMDSLIEGTQ